MKRWLYRLQYKYSRYGVENLMMYVVVTMLAVYLAQMMFGIAAYASSSPQAWWLRHPDAAFMGYMNFHRGLILEGQIWRIITFLFLPIGGGNPFLVLLSLYVFYFLGNTLENEWGAFSFSMYYAFGIAGAIIAGFISGVGNNQYIYMSILLAFAQLFPNMEFRMFFLIPIKVKYIGYVTWILYGLGLLAAIAAFDLPEVAAILVSLINFFLFFGPDLYSSFLTWNKYRGRRRQFRQSDKNHWR